MEKSTIKSLNLVIKKKSQRLIVNFTQTRVGPNRQLWNDQNRKNSDQRLSRALENIFEQLQPHLLYATELAGPEIKLGKEIDERKFFDEFEFKEIPLFQGLQITSIEFIGNESIDSVKLKGYRETQLTNKPFKVPLQTGVINLDRAADNHYPLVHILIEQIDDLETCVQNWLQGETSDAPVIADEDNGKVF